MEARRREGCQYLDNSVGICERAFEDHELTQDKVSNCGKTTILNSVDQINV